MFSLATCRYLAVVAGLALLNFVAAVQGPRPDKATPQDRVIARFSVANDGDLLLVPVQVGGKCYSFWLDTGTTVTIYDSSLCHLLGKPIRREELRTPQGKVETEIFNSPQAKLGPFSLCSGEEVACFDLKQVREYSGCDVWGIVGMDFLSQHIFRLDPDRGELVFLGTSGPNAGELLRVSVMDSVPYVEASLQGLDAPEQFRVDTGMQGEGTVRQTVYYSLAKNGAINGIEDTAVFTLSGIQEHRNGHLKSITVGRHRHANLIFNDGGIGILGLDYWLRYVVTFDFPENKLYLKPSRHYDEPSVHGLSGLSLVRRNGKVVVDDVQKGRAADKAGIKPQDVIETIAGADASIQRLHRIGLLLCKQNTKLDITVKRGSSHLRINLVLGEGR
jgi:hypothetical protein